MIIIAAGSCGVKGVLAVFSFTDIDALVFSRFLAHAFVISHVNFTKKQKNGALPAGAINDYITAHFAGDCLLVVGDEETIKLHFHTNRPWEVLEYMASLGDIYDVVIENMERQARGQRG